MSQIPSNDYRPASSKELETLHQASLHILEKTGITFQSQPALDLFKKAGTRVEGERVFIPARLVEWALKTVPHELTIYNRNLEPAMLIGGDRRTSYYGVGSDSVYINDPVDGKRRKAVLKDISNGMRLVSGLEHVHFVMSMFLPSDISDQDYSRHQMVVMLNENIKPILFTGLTRQCAVEAMDMAGVIHGKEALSKQPFIINYVNTVNAMMHNGDSVQRLMDAAAQNLPTIYAPGNSKGTSAPMTAAGMLALGNAGQLAGLVLSQLVREGSPFILNNPSVGLMDMRTMVDLYVSPDGGVYGCALANYYGLAALCSAGAADSKVFDAQAAAEAALTLFSTTFRGANLIQNLGYLDSAMTGSFEMIVLCNEIIGWLKHFLAPLETDAESLALDVIDSVAHDCNFLGTDHTLSRFRDDWVPGLFDRKSYLQWTQTGEKDLAARANYMVQDLLKQPEVAPLPPQTLERLKAML